MTGPEKHLAALWHNWQWFAMYIWEEDVEIPVDLEKEKKENGGNVNPGLGS